MSELTFVDELPSTGVGRPGQLKQKIEGWIPQVQAHPGQYAPVETPDRQLYGRANSIRHIFNARNAEEDGGKFKVATRRNKPEEGEKWAGDGTVYVGFFTNEQLAAEAAESKGDTGNGAAEVDITSVAPEPVTV